MKRSHTLVWSCWCVWSSHSSNSKLATGFVVPSLRGRKFGSSSNIRSMSHRRGGGRGGGRGEYYKNKYGGGGSGRGRGGRETTTSRGPRVGGSYQELQNLLRNLDGKPYPAYHDLDTDLSSNGWRHGDGFAVFCERAQSDPFAPPTRCRIVVHPSRAGFPPVSYSNTVRAVALADFLLRSLHQTCQRLGADASMTGSGWKGPKGGDLQVLEPCQHVLEQSAVRVDETNGSIVAQIAINLPARGRTILGHAAETIFTKTIPQLVQESLCYASLPPDRLRHHVEMVEDQAWLSDQLESSNLVAFVRNGAVLPRRSGADDRPMDSKTAVRFQSPQRLETSFTLPNAGTTITGMEIPRGITLICGGGFHGKSTLLETLQLGIYPKIPGDGREFCATSRAAVKIRAEDGRNIQNVDISNFINNLPFRKDTACFSSEDASGSTSQATGIVEALECGATALLMDEDTCATNFMIRDDKMMQLVAAEKEPITPFVRTVRSLCDDFGVSSILVIGGTGDYLDVADNVLVMDSYQCLDATEKAMAIVANAANKEAAASSASVVFRPLKRMRTIHGDAFAADGKVKTISASSISFGQTELDLKGLEQLASKAQTVAISAALQRLPELSKPGQSFKDTLDDLEKLLDRKGLDGLTPGQCHGGMARPRMYEIAGAINRLRREKSISQE